MEDSNNKLKVSHMNPIDVEKLDRIKRLMKFYDLSQTSLSERLGVMQSNVSAILNGKRPCGKSMDAKFQLAFPEINKSWFLDGTGEMLNEDYTSFNPVAVGPATTGAEDPDAEVKSLELLVAELQSKVDILLEQVAKKDAQIDRLIKLLEK